MKIGILGGTFNPPHVGHIVIAKEIKNFLGLDKILFIPTNIPPHKKFEEIGGMHRLNMIKLMIAGEEDFEALDLELKKGGISHTIDTIKILKEKFSHDEIFLIVGSDLANTFESWKDFPELRELVNIVVAKRDEYPLKNSGGFNAVDITQINISSSQLRDMIKNGADIKIFVKENVAGYIKKNQLYFERKERI